MTSRTVRAIASGFVLFAAGCGSGDPPTSPTDSEMSARIAAVGEAFEVRGIVTDAAGTPLQGIPVGMRYWLGGFLQTAKALTDGAGAYTISFTANPWSESRGRAAARAELIAEPYEWYYRTVYATAPQIVENFRLHQQQRVPAGESVVVMLGPEAGGCVGGLTWTLARVCRNVRVTAAVNGTLTVGAISPSGSGQPLVAVCCVNGDDTGGNPVTLKASAGTVYTVEVGLLDVPDTAQVIEVTTSFKP